MSWIAEKVISPLRYSPMSRPESAINRVRHDSLGDLLNTYIDDSPLPSNDHHRHVIDINSGGGGGPQRQFVLSFTDLTYSVPTKSGTNKTLLNSITGNAREGEILAVLGASGSGKSTLIDALAHRIKKQSLRGTITLNGQQVQEKLLKSISAYVMQDDLMFPMLTVEETLMFSAEFRLPRTLSKSKKFARVQTLIDQLGLRAAAKTVIGDEGHRGVSGGERRRVSIGTDIIHDPIVLFLDEPTSGLDSTSAFMVVQVLQRIAHSGSVVIMSIHQPSYRILGLLDRLIILTRGQTVYNGAPTGLPLYLSEFQNPIPENENPIEFALDLIRELEPSESDIAKLVQFSKEWRNMTTPSSSTYVTSVPLKDAIATSINRGKLVAGGTTFANPLWAEIFILAKRSITNSRRMPEQILVRLGAVLVTGFILATIFWRLDHSPKGATERLGFLAFAMSTVYYTCAEALPVFLQERYIFMRETAYNTYRRSSYVLSNAAVGFPSLILLAFAFTVVTFFAVGLAGGIGGCVFFFLAVLASFWAGSSFVTFLSGMIPDVMMGYTVVVAILAYFLLFSGFFINRDRIPGYWIWFHYLSLVKYPYEAVLQNEFEGSSTCFARGLQIFDDTLLERLPVEIKRKALDAVSRALGARIDENTCVTNGAGILRQVGVGAISKWDRLLVTVAFGFLFRVLFYFTLLLGSKNKRR